jgi:hypothetical protein
VKSPDGAGAAREARVVPSGSDFDAWVSLLGVTSKRPAARELARHADPTIRFGALDALRLADQRAG